MGPRRAVISGLGVVAPSGIGKQAFWDGLIAGRSAVDRITAFDAGLYPCRVAAEVRSFRPEEFMPARRAKYAGRFSQFAVAAGKLAVADAALALPRERPERVMVCIGNALNGAGDVYEVARAAFQKEGLDGIPPTTGLEFAAHASVSHVSRELGIGGQAETMASACVTGLDAMEWGRAKIAAGHADVVIAGSTEAPISEFCFATLCALRVLTGLNDPPARASRPYDLRRDGIVLGEGAAVYVLEELEHARDRGARVYAEILGFGSGNEAGCKRRKKTNGLFGTAEAGEAALVRAIQAALAKANLRAADIDYINAHGNALPDYDRIETRAFKRALGTVIRGIPVSSVKSMIGHAMGAGSAFQVVATCLSIERSLIPPTINLESPDPECDLDYVPNHARVTRVRNALINAHAMGGTHSVAILGRPGA